MNMKRDDGSIIWFACWTFGWAPVLIFKQGNEQNELRNTVERGTKRTLNSFYSSTTIRHSRLRAFFRVKHEHSIDYHRCEFVWQLWNYLIEDSYVAL